jgi:hypothetical protein
MLGPPNTAFPQDTRPDDEANGDPGAFAPFYPPAGRRGGTSHQVGRRGAGSTVKICASSGSGASIVTRGDPGMAPCRQPRDADDHVLEALARPA